MTRLPTFVVLAGIVATLRPAAAAGQTFPADDPVLRAIWQEGMMDSRVESLAQVLMDSLGPRLPATPESEAALDWAEGMYERWGIEAGQEPYGTWAGWRRGATHVDLIEPRARTLDAMLLGWSVGTDGPVTAPVTVLPDEPASVEELRARLGGRFLLGSAPEPSCRPADNWQQWGGDEALARMRAARDSVQAAFGQRVANLGIPAGELARTIDRLGVVGLLVSDWPDGWGVARTHTMASPGTTAPRFALSCEDYGLLWRLAANGQGPVVRVDADAERLGETPVSNLIARIEGAELPDEYVMLSAHFDSWDGASGATDNGAGTVVVMEAMRILREAYPRPKRTLLVGHWNGEEQGLNGSRAWVADHPEVTEGLQVLLNHDSGTGRVTNVSMLGLAEAQPFFERWLTRIPGELAGGIEIQSPGRPGSGSDYGSFLCAPAPAFQLGLRSWDYAPQTWHTTLDTFDKLVIDDLRNNATLIAMLAYLASEDPRRMPRTTVTLPVDQRTGQPAPWPSCRDGARSSGR